MCVCIHGSSCSRSFPMGPVDWTGSSDLVACVFPAEPSLWSGLYLWDQWCFLCDSLWCLIWKSYLKCYYNYLFKRKSCVSWCFFLRSSEHYCLMCPRDALCVCMCKCSHLQCSFFSPTSTSRAYIQYNLFYSAFPM